MKRACIVLFGLTAASGCKKQVKTADVESFLTGRLGELGIAPSRVSCPKNIEAKQGSSFECNVDIEGKTYVVVATVTAIDGNQVKYDNQWKNGEAVFRNRIEKPLGEMLTKDLGAPVTVACPDALLFLDANRAVACDLTAGATKAKVVMTMDAELVPTTWKLDPPLMSKKKLEEGLTENIRKATAPDATVTCGDQALVPRPADGSVVCNVDSGDKHGHVKVAIGADLVPTSWEIVP